MKTAMKVFLAAAPLASVFLLPTQVFGEIPPQIPAAIAAPDEVAIATFHAEGAQLYECRRGTRDKLVWQFREPVATLMLDGKTIGTHYAARTGNTPTEVACAPRLQARFPVNHPMILRGSN